MFPRTCDVRHVGILFHFFINSARFRKKCFVFFSFVVRFRLVIRFYSHFLVCWLDVFPNTRFSNRSDCILRVKLSLSPRAIRSFFIVVRIDGFHAISGDTNSNGETNKCWWTNKARMSDLLFTIHQHGGDDVT